MSVDWGAEVEESESGYSKHLEEFLEDMKQKPEVLKAINDIGDKYGLPPLTDKQIVELLYGRQVGSARKKRKTRKTRRKHVKRISSRK
jgi:hypothetical protein